MSRLTQRSCVTSLLTLLSDNLPLAVQDAVAAIIVIGDHRYLVQHRDDKPGIWYPGFWGCFGGAVDAGETPEGALRRELYEELGLSDVDCASLGDILFQIPGQHDRHFYRHYYEVRLPAARMDRLVLGEGASMQAVDAQELFGRLRLVPYDAFAIFLYLHRHRLIAGGQTAVAS